MSYATSLRCVSCGRTVELEPFRYACPACSGPLEVQYDEARMRSELSTSLFDARHGSILDQWKELLPIERPDWISRVSLGQQPTPMVRANRMSLPEGDDVWLKLEYMGPTCSLKDRSMPMVMLKALEQKRQAVGTVSTGNAAASLSAHAAGAGLSAIVFLGKDAPPSKLFKTLIYNPVAIQVQGSYMEADVLFQKAREEFGFFDCQGMVNPFRLEGKKTFAYEIVRDLGWQAPAAVFIPTASGTGVVAAWNGFRLLHRLGFINSLPAIIAVQPAICGPIAEAFSRGLDGVQPVAGGHSIAEAVSVSDPGSGGDRALKAVRESGGMAMAVSDTEISDALRLLADREGLAVEPAGAVGLAAVQKLNREGNPWRGGRQIVSLTGHGLNDVQFGSTVVQPPIRVEADYSAVREALARVLRAE